MVAIFINNRVVYTFLRFFKIRFSILYMINNFAHWTTSFTVMLGPEDYSGFVENRI